MAATTACIAGEEVHRQWQAGSIRGTPLGSRQTPFGPSGDLFLAEGEGQPFYLLPRYGVGMGKTAPSRINYRANIYALKDMGTQCILAWGSGGAITHSFAVGDIVILNDLIDQTHLRIETFFENSPLGFLRQFPVFCPSMRRVVAEVLHDMKLVYHGTGTAAVTEGPRLETPAEVRWLTSIGAEVVTHTFVPEVFLARELQMCYVGVCYVVNYAETGSRQQPFIGGGLFGALDPNAGNKRLAGVLGSITRIASNVADAVEKADANCQCARTLRHYTKEYNLGDDWRTWFDKVQ